MPEKRDDRLLAVTTTAPVARRVPTNPASGITAPMPRIDGLIGRVLSGRFTITQLIAKGGMGRVYLGEQSPLGRAVALKVLDGSEEAGQDAEFRSRFMLEAAATSKLTHPNTVRIFDYGQTDDDIFYIAMERLDGRTLHQAIKEDGPLSPERVVHIMRQVCASLREAHGLGLIHRDLKPSNVMLLRTGEEPEFVKVLDFGLVKEVASNQELTRVDAVVGSPSYMSPEQIRSGRIDGRSDIYSLGVLMYTCLAGRPPFTGTSSVNLLMAHLHNPVPPIAERVNLQRAPIVEWIVMRCLEKEAGARFATVDDLGRALRLAAAELRGERPSRPTLDAEGRLVVSEEPTPSSSLRLQAPNALPPDERGSASSATRHKPPSRAPFFAALGVGSVVVGGVALVLLVVGGWYLATSLRDPAPAALAAPVVAMPAEPAVAPPPTAQPVAVPAPADVAVSKPRPAGPKPSPAPSAQAVPEPAATPASPPPADEPKRVDDLKDPWAE